MLGAETYSLWPLAVAAALGIVFVLFPGVYLAINNAVHRRSDPIRSKLLARLIGTGLILLAIATWFRHRGEFR